MASVKRSLSTIKSMPSIRTMAGLVDGRRSRNTAGALLELSALANERERLHQEQERWRRRHKEIEIRLAEIAEKEQRLQTFVKSPTSETPAKPLPIAAAPRRVTARELRY